MNFGTLWGGGVALPVSVVYMLPHDSTTGMSSNPAKPFIEAGAGPPLIGLSVAHWLLHHVTWLVGVATRSPMTNVAPLPVAKAKIRKLQVTFVVLPPASVIVVVTVKGPVDVYVWL